MKLKRMLLLILCFCFSFNLCVFADTDVNVDGGGGGSMGSGTGTSYWSNGDDGVRVSVIDRKLNEKVTAAVDFSNKQQTVDYFFGYQDKLHYMMSAALHVYSGKSYRNYVPKDKLPKIIYGDGTNNIAAVKDYFRNDKRLKEICGYIKFSYDELIEGNNYALLIEPIAYFTYSGFKYAMTATEAAKYNRDFEKGKLKSAMGSLTHCNLPRSMYLQWPDLRIETPEQPFKERSTDNEIIETLGVGIIRFDTELEETAVPSEYDYITDNDVITSFHIPNPLRENCTPDKGMTVAFSMTSSTGERQSLGAKEYVCPKGSSQLVWIRWHTPTEPCTVTVTASVGGKSHTVQANVVEFPEVEPPNPEYYDTNDGFRLGNYSSSKYAMNNKMSNSWSYWEAFKEYTDEGYYWRFIPQSGKASLYVDAEVYPDERVKTAIKEGSRYTMKSAYGVDIKVDAYVIGSGVSDDNRVFPQVVSARFPEFEWKTYNRLLEITEKKYNYYNIWELKENPASYYNYRVHFTPLWYPDKTDYPVYIDVLSCWTPAGQLTYSKAVNDIEIDGNVYDDWYIRNY